MKYLPFILKHLRRNWIRTVSTVVAMATCIFLICTLRSVLTEINGLLDATSAARLVTRHAVGLTFNLPLAYEPRIQTVPGVKRVALTSWFGGMLPAKKEAAATTAKGGKKKESGPDMSNFFPNFAVEAEPYFAMYPELQVKPEEWQAFLHDQQGCLIGRRLAEKFKWKVGDHIFLESFIAPYRKSTGPFEYVVEGMVDTDPIKYPATNLTIMYFHYKYLYEGTGRRLGAGTYTVEIDDPQQAGVVSKAIDATFENSDAQTHTETERGFFAGFISMAGNLALLLNGIGMAVAFTILLVTANTMSMAVRERRTEIAVLKTLGFTSARVMGLIVAEAVALGALGGALGVGASKGLMFLLTSVPALTDMLANFGLSSLTLKPAVAVTGLLLALFLGFAAGFVPAWNAYRSKITDMLRTV